MSAGRMETRMAFKSDLDIRTEPDLSMTRSSWIVSSWKRYVLRRVPLYWLQLLGISFDVRHNIHPRPRAAYCTLCYLPPPHLAYLGH